AVRRSPGGRPPSGPPPRPRCPRNRARRRSRSSRAGSARADRSRSRSGRPLSVRSPLGSTSSLEVRPPEGGQLYVGRIRGGLVGHRLSLLPAQEGHEGGVGRLRQDRGELLGAAGGGLAAKQALD